MRPCKADRHYRYTSDFKAKVETVMAPATKTAFWATRYTGGKNNKKWK